MSQSIPISKPISEVPPERLVTVWDLKSGQLSKMSKARWQRLAKPTKPFGGVHTDFYRRHYILSDYPGQAINMFHLGTGKQIVEMTLSLLQEIQKRNPPEKVPTYDANGNKISDTYEWWRNFLADEIEVKGAVKQIKTTEEIIREQVAEALRLAGVNQPINEVKTADYSAPSIDVKSYDVPVIGENKQIKTGRRGKAKQNSQTEKV